MHDVIIVGIPFLAVLAGILFNRLDFQRLDRKLDELRATTGSKIDDFRKTTNSKIDDLRETTNRRFDDLKDASHWDALEIMRSMTALHERVAVVESKQESKAA